jgi:tetratricopeptide (TPR) repeat protein
MRKFLTIVFMLAALTGMAQKKKKSKEDKPAAEPIAVQTVAPAPQVPAADTMINPLIEHYYKKYTLATRWSDHATAKDALYDLIVETGSDSLAYNLALVYYENQQYASAALISKDLLARKPKNPLVLQLAASSFEGLGLIAQALPNYESLYLLTDNTAVLYKMATLQYDSKLYPESQANVDILMSRKDLDSLEVSVSGQGNSKQYPLKVALLNLKGLLAQQAGNKVLARKSYDDALAISPDFKLAKENLAKLK